MEKSREERSRVKRALATALDVGCHGSGPLVSKATNSGEGMLLMRRSMGGTPHCCCLGGWLTCAGIVASQALRAEVGAVIVGLVQVILLVLEVLEGVKAGCRALLWGAWQGWHGVDTGGDHHTRLLAPKSSGWGTIINPPLSRQTEMCPVNHYGALSWGVLCTGTWTGRAFSPVCLLCTPFRLFP